MISPRAVAAVLVALVSIAGSARAHIVSDREVKLLRALPAGMIRTAGALDRPDTAGRVGLNRGAWVAVSHQHGAMLLLAEAAARADTAATERAWKAIDAAFVQQRPDGGFQFAAGGRNVEAEELASAALWLGELCRGIVAVNNSRLAPRFQWRWALLQPKLRRSITWLTAAAATLEAGHPRDPAVLLASAQTFLLADGMFHEPQYNAIGLRALTAALALQRKDGAFLVEGRAGAAAQALCLGRLAEITIYFPAPSLERTAGKAAHWLAAQVKGNGEIKAAGPVAPAVRRDVIAALAYLAQQSNDAGLRKAAERAYAPYRRTPPAAEATTDAR